MATPEVGVPANKPAVYLSLSSPEADAWKQQLLIYGIGVFSVGVLVGWAGRAAKSPPTMSPRVRRLTEREIYSLSRRKK